MTRSIVSIDMPSKHAFCLIICRFPDLHLQIHCAKPISPSSNQPLIRYSRFTLSICVPDTACLCLCASIRNSLIVYIYIWSTVPVCHLSNTSRYSVLFCICQCYYHSFSVGLCLLGWHISRFLPCIHNPTSFAGSIQSTVNTSIFSSPADVIMKLSFIFLSSGVHESLVSSGNDRPAATCRDKRKCLPAIDL